MINTTVKLLIIMPLLLPISHTLNTPDVLHESAATSCSKRLTQAYALYVAIIKEYENKWQTVEYLQQEPDKLRKKFHEIVLNAHNQSVNSSSLLDHKKNKAYQELPYLYFKKNLDTTKKAITNHLEKLETEALGEQSAIFYCLQHALTKIESLDAFIITTSEYYQEQIKIASVSPKSSFMLHIFQTSLGFIAKKLIPIF